MSEQYDLVVRARTAVLPGGVRPVSVGVLNRAIAAVGSFDAPLNARAETVLPDDQVLLPGVVDTHVHVNEPGRTDWEGFASATRAAAAGGITAIIDMPLNSIPPTTTPEALEAKRQAAVHQATVDVGFWGGAIPANLGSLKPLHDAGVFGFKAFLSPSGVPEFPAISAAELVTAAAEIASFDGMLIVHAEDPEVLDRHRHAGGTSFGDFAASRPETAERTAIDHVVDAVRQTGVRAHILHLSSARALAGIRAAKAEGLPITVETCPHYLTFSVESIPDGATEYKCCPPIRDEANRELLWKALENGDIDLIASDHSPATPELKLSRGGDFALAWGGISGLQVSLAAVWTGARARGIPIDKVSAWMSDASARFAGLPHKGRIEIGADADLVAFSPDASFTVDARVLRHKNPISAFDGYTLFGRVEMTWVGGTAVFGGASALSEAASSTAAHPALHGRLLTRPAQVAGSGDSAAP